MKSIYLDYAATTPVDPAVLDAMLPYLGAPTANSSLLTAGWGNPGSLHSFGQQASGAVFIARQMIAKELNCHYGEVIFTGSATEANNLALRGVISKWKLVIGEASPKLRITNYQLRPRVIISAVEHESILATARDLESEGVEVVIIPVSKEGLVDLKKLKAALNENTIVVSVMYGNNEVGSIQPIAEIAKMLRNWKLVNRNSGKSNYQLPITNYGYPLFHTDAAQAFQYIECDVQKLGVDMLTLSAHKIYGPKGIGALYVRRILNARLQPITYSLQPCITGGGQEFGLRSGTENVPAIIGFAKAVSLAAMSREEESARVAKLRDEVWRGVKEIFPKAALNGPAVSGKPSAVSRIPNNLNFYVPKVSGEQLLVALDLHGIAVSTGSACAARSIDPSHVLLAMGHPHERAKNSLRVTLGRMTTRAEIASFLRMLRAAKESLD